MQLSDEQAWQEFVTLNADGYGLGIIQFAERWADAMEQAMAGGQSVADCAGAAGDEADTKGITGFMYGAAVSTLSQCWVHGEELRRWHNLGSQLGTEGEQANESGGVLNPAVIRIRG